MIKESLKLININKHFGGIKALENVSIEVYAGRIYGIVGANGAGKSTLMKVMNGVNIPDSGTILADDEEVRFSSPMAAQEHGVGMVYQELNLLPDLSITENVYISHLSSGRSGHINWKELERKTKEKFLEVLNMEIDPRRKVGELKVAQQQIVAIMRAVILDCRLLILDEPTSALPVRDVKNLFRIMRQLKDQGYIILFISHKLDEVIEITDQVIAMRNGRKIAELDKDTDGRGITEENLTELIAGRKLTDRFPKKHFPRGKELLRLENVSVKGKLENISFTLHQGEILGLCGLLGAGKSEVTGTLFGVYGASAGTLSGNIVLDGRPYHPRNPQEAIRRGIGLVPENRAKEGLMTSLSIRNNMTLASLKKYSRFGYMNRKQEEGKIEELITSLSIKCQSPDQTVTSLSGGNQQKVVLGKWMSSDIRLLIFDEPTRGIDIGAKAEIYELMNKLVEMGIGVIITSSEIDEVRSMSDRVLLLSEGRLIEELNSGEVTDDGIYEILMEDVGGLS